MKLQIVCHESILYQFLFLIILNFLNNYNKCKKALFSMLHEILKPFTFCSAKNGITRKKYEIILRRNNNFKKIQRESRIFPIKKSLKVKTNTSYLNEVF